MCRVRTGAVKVEGVANMADGFEGTVNEFLAEFRDTLIDVDLTFVHGGEATNTFALLRQLELSLTIADPSSLSPFCLMRIAHLT